MQRIRTVIADDEPLARRGMRAHLALEKDIEIVSECRNGREAVEAIATHAPDLVFLDVHMPELDGFGVVEAVGAQRMPTVIFVTAYDRYALRAFEVHALDYLLKPFESERFSRAVQRARSQIERETLDDFSARLRNLLAGIDAEQKYARRLVIKSSGRVTFLAVPEIDWIEAADNYVRIHAGEESHLLRETMNSLEDRLDPDQFVRVHRSRIVNIEKIKELQPIFRGEYEIVMRNGKRLESGRAYRDRIQKLLA